MPATPPLWIWVCVRTTDHLPCGELELAVRVLWAADRASGGETDPREIRVTLATGLETCGVCGSTGEAGFSAQNRAGRWAGRGLPHADAHQHRRRKPRAELPQ